MTELVPSRRPLTERELSALDAIYQERGAAYAAAAADDPIGYLEARGRSYQEISNVGLQAVMFGAVSAQALQEAVNSAVQRIHRGHFEESGSTEFSGLMRPICNTMMKRAAELITADSAQSTKVAQELLWATKAIPELCVQIATRGLPPPPYTMEAFRTSHIRADLAQQVQRMADVVRNFGAVVSVAADSTIPKSSVDWIRLKECAATTVKELGALRL